jgi:HEAT repeat protein
MITPEQYDSTPVYDLLREASEGRIGIDQRLIRSIIDRRGAAVADLVKWGTEDHEQAPVDLTEDIENMLLFLNVKESVPFFIHQLRLNPEDVSDTAVEALYKQREHALEPLLELYSNLEEEVAGEVVFILATFRIQDDRVLQILLDRLEYDAGDGAICLGVYGDPAAKPPLERLLDEVGDSDPHLKTDITGAIAELGRSVEDAFPDEFNIWDLYPEVAPPQFDMLNEADRIAMLNSESAAFRAQATSSFTNREFSDAARKRIFELARTDPDLDVRSEAWEALGDELEGHKDIRDAMFARLSDRSAPIEERASALIGLADELRTNRELRSFAEEFYHNGVSRAKAMTAMSKSFDRTFAEYFPQHLEDPDEDVQRAAIWGVGYLGVTAASERLVPLFEDEDLRNDALFAYALSARHETSKSRIPGLYRKIEERAGGLSVRESEIVQLALDERLMLHGHDPVYFTDEFLNSDDEEEEDNDVPPEAAAIPKVGRNDPCPCGSGKKYKKCHGG